MADLARSAQWCTARHLRGAACGGTNVNARAERFSLPCFTRLQVPLRVLPDAWRPAASPQPSPSPSYLLTIFPHPHPPTSSPGSPLPSPTCLLSTSPKPALFKPSPLQEVEPSAAPAASGRHAVPIPGHACALFNRSGFDCSKYRALPPSGLTPYTCHLLQCTLGLWGSEEDERLARGRQEVVEPGFEPKTP